MLKALTNFVYQERNIGFIRENWIPVMSANVEVCAFVLVQLDHVLVEGEFELLVLGVLEEPRAYLLGDDLGPDVVLGSQAKPHLLKDQLHLLFPLHRSVSFNLEVLHRLARGRNVFVSLLHLRQSVGQIQR